MDPLFDRRVGVGSRVWHDGGIGQPRPDLRYRIQFLCDGSRLAGHRRGVHDVVGLADY